MTMITNPPQNNLQCGVLLMTEHPKPNQVARGFLLNCKFLVFKIAIVDNGLAFTYENEVGEYDTYVLGNDSPIRLHNGYICWEVDMPNTRQCFALRLGN